MDLRYILSSMNHEQSFNNKNGSLIETRKRLLETKLIERKPQSREYYRVLIEPPLCTNCTVHTWDLAYALERMRPPAKRSREKGS
jgi:hypothetical protein